MKTYLSLKLRASGSLLIRKSMIPSIIKEAFDSPGCTLELRMIAGLSAMSSYELSRFVIISMSSALPAMDRVSCVLLRRSLVVAGLQTLLR